MVQGISSVAQTFGVSREALRKAFLRSEGVSISQYVAEQRLDFIKTMLVTTAKPCFQICFEAGYRREDCCARAFRKLTGISMRQYRSSVNSNN